MSKGLERRRRMVVHADQWKVLLRLSFAFFGTLGIFSVLVFVSPLVLGFLLNASEWGMDESAFRGRSLLSFAILPLLCATLVLFACGLRETFHLVGPTVRFRRVFRELEKLRVPSRVPVRDTDYLREVTESIDRSMARLHREIGEMQVLSRAAVADLDSEGSAATFPGALSSTVRALQERLARFELLGDAPCEPVSPEDGDELGVTATASAEAM